MKSNPGNCHVSPYNGTGKLVILKVKLYHRVKNSTKI